MSDTDEDIIFPNSFLNLPRENTISRIPSSNVNNNKSSFSYCNNIMTSNLNMPKHYNGYDQRSFYTRRETSPLSLKSFPNSRMQDKHPYYQSAMSSQGSVYNGRCTSPMSIRSTDSTATAADIALAFKTCHFNNNDIQIIKNAYKTYMKNRVRKRINKRRNLKSFIKQYCKKSGGESGAEGSDSSMSSDDCRSTRSAFYKENIQSMRARSRRIDVNTFTKQMNKNDIYKDCTEKFKQNCFSNLVNAQSSRTMTNRSIHYHNFQNHRHLEIPQNATLNSLEQMSQGKNHALNDLYNKISHNERCTEISENHTNKDQHSKQFETSVFSQKERFAKNSTLLPFQRFNCTEISENHTNKDQHSKQFETSVFSQKERFAKNSTLLPFQRFNKSVTTYEVSYKKKPNNNQTKKTSTSNNNENEHISSESDTIFSQPIRGENVTQSSALQNKRVLEDVSYPESKKNKLHMSSKNHSEKSPKNMKILKNNNFNFKKPQLPIRKYKSLMKDADAEVLISSSQPVLGNVEPICNQLKQVAQVHTHSKENNSKSNNKHLSQFHTDTITNDILVESMHNSTEVSMKPSFIKRKLFTQKLDVVENKNVCADNLVVNSPQAKTVREKNKVRKLTGQSCLSRDDVGDNNVLDLIHKIVPPEQINVTSVNKREANTSRWKKDDKWDVTSVISMCRDSDASDTFTDEEIFKAQGPKRNAKQVNKDTDKRPKMTNAAQEIEPQCKVVLDKLKVLNVEKNTQQNENPSTKKRTVKECVKSFWDTDFESDMEDLSWKLKLKDDQVQKDFLESSTNTNTTRNDRPKSTILTVKQCQNVRANNKIRTNVNDSVNGVMSGSLKENNNKIMPNNNNELIKSNRSRSKIRDPLVNNNNELNRSNRLRSKVREPQVNNNNERNRNNRSRSKIRDPQVNNNNELNKSNRFLSKNKERQVKTQEPNSKKSKNEATLSFTTVSDDSNIGRNSETKSQKNNKLEKPTPNRCSSTNTKANKKSQSIIQMTRQSPRLKAKRDEICNTSIYREKSIRVKQKRDKRH